MANVVIIGAGPAGVSAALYTARAGVDTTVLTKGPGALARAEGIENYYGVPGPVSGAELERRGIEGAEAVGVKFVHTEAVGLTFTDKLTVETLAGDFPADAVILATGASRAAPPVPGLAALEGRGVSYCATCDAFFYRGKDVAVLGSGEYALHEIAALLPLAKSVTLLTGGAELTASFPAQVAVRTQKVEAILGPDKVSGVQLAGGEVLPVDGVFVAMGVWNDYLLSSLFLNTQEMRTLPMMIRVFCAQYSNDYAPMMAGLVMSILPMLIFYLAGQKQILEGVVQGSVKG